MSQHAVIKWGMSILDWRRHAVDLTRDHPIGVYKAECGQNLMVVTPLCNNPLDNVCAECRVVALKEEPTPFV
jgi:hypothetical protein